MFLPKARTGEMDLNLGEAAHIYAASDTGPRGNAFLHDEQITSIDNGIWLCRHHARIIDADQINYSAETLQQWKELAEKAAYEKLKNLEAEAFSKKMEGLAAWQGGEVYQLYLLMGLEALSQKTSIDEVIQARQAASQAVLTMDEFTAVNDLNQRLQF